MPSQELRGRRPLASPSGLLGVLRRGKIAGGLVVRGGVHSQLGYRPGLLDRGQPRFALDLVDQQGVPAGAVRCVFPRRNRIAVPVDVRLGCPPAILVAPVASGAQQEPPVAAPVITCVKGRAAGHMPPDGSYRRNSPGAWASGRALRCRSHSGVLQKSSTRRITAHRHRCSGPGTGDAWPSLSEASTEAGPSSG